MIEIVTSFINDGISHAQKVNSWLDDGYSILSNHVTDKLIVTFLFKEAE